MAKDVEIEQHHIEDFCINYLRKLGYIVRKVKNIKVEHTEAGVIKYFYQKAANVPSDSLGDEFKSYEKDAAVLRKLVTRFEELGMSYQTILEHIISLIDFLFDNPEICGGPFKNFRIFSSVQFLDTLSFQYEMSEEARNEDEWNKQAKLDFSNKKTDMKQIKDSLAKIKEAVLNGKKSSC